MISKGRQLKELLHSPKILIAPGVYDGFSARLVEKMGFKTASISGAGISESKIGWADRGIMGFGENVEACRKIAAFSNLLLQGDADTGYGNALNVQRTMRMFERAGATALQLEDQSFPKRCGHLTDKAVIPAGEMAGKIKAAVDARASENTLIIARTDAVAVEGVPAALDRARLYVEAGADVLFVEAPKSREQLSAIAPDLGGIRPLLANMVEGGQTPISSAADLGDLGYRLVIFPGGIVRALARQAQDYYASLAAHGTTQPFRDRMFDFNALNDLIGTPEMLALGETYKDFTSAKREDAA